MKKTLIYHVIVKSKVVLLSIAALISVSIIAIAANFGLLGPLPTSFSRPLAPAWAIAKVSNERVTLSWAKVDGAKWYVYERYNNSDDKLIGRAIRSASLTTAVSGTNVPIGSYYYKVYAKNDIGLSPAAFSNNFTKDYDDALPEAPDWMAVTISGNRATLSWEKVDGAEKYVYERYDNGKYCCKATRSASLPTAVSGDLPPDASYSYRVYAENSSTTSLARASNVIRVGDMAKASPTQPPMPPKEVFVSVFGDKVDAKWEQVGDASYFIEHYRTNGAYIASYYQLVPEYSFSNSPEGSFYFLVYSYRGGVKSLVGRKSNVFNVRFCAEKCSDIGQECGVLWDNGCGETINCPSCSNGTCTSGVCIPEVCPLRCDSNNQCNNDVCAILTKTKCIDGKCATPCLIRPDNCPSGNWCGYNTGKCLNNIYTCYVWQKTGDADKNGDIDNKDIYLMADMVPGYFVRFLSFTNNDISCLDVDGDGYLTPSDRFMLQYQLQ